jgi:ABC-type sugar transport system ATPase subunit
MATIQLEHVTKRYPDGTEAVRSLDLNITDGEFIVFVGPSGCGKSTALNMIAGLEDISDGELRFNGKVVNQLTPKDRDIAMVFQTYALYPHMTVRQNMAFPLKIAKVPQDDIDRRVKEGPNCSSSTSTWTASRPTCQAASASGWPWAARSCGTRRRSSWTSRCPTWTPSCAARCGPRSPGCSNG